MAVENFAILNGQIEDIKTKTKDGEIALVIIALKVIRRRKASMEIAAGGCSVDFPLIMVRNKEMLEEIKDITIGDMLQVIGTISTVPYQKTFICSECKHEEKYMGTKTFVSPILIEVRENSISNGGQISEKTGMDLIKKRDQISNRIALIGHLCQDPIFYNEGFRVCSYQLGINRLIHVKEDAPEIRTDYPWIRSLGDQAEKDASTLKKGSLVYIVGSLQARNIYRNGFNVEVKCEECGAMNAIVGDTMEIVPYHVEYMENVTLPEPEKEAELEMDEEEDDDYEYEEDYSTLKNMIPDYEDEDDDETTITIEV